MSDTGKVIAPDIDDKIVDPYFDSKDKGTGIHLAMFHGIVKSHGGFIDVQSGAAQDAAFQSIVIKSY